MSWAWWNKADHAKECFDEYQRWFQRLDVTDQEIDVTLTVRVRAFGNEQRKQQVWDEAWRTPEQQAKRGAFWGKAAAGVSVSSSPPEIWCNMRKTEAGLVLPMHITGHELLHTLKLNDDRVGNPDLLINEDTY